MNYILINLKDPLLKQKKVREALAFALNRSEIIKYKLHDMASEATSLLSPSNFFFHKGLKNLPFQIEKSQKIIQSLQLKGKTLTLKTSNNPSTIDRGKVIAHQLSLSGLKVKIQSYEWGTFYGDIGKGNFQLALMRWVGIIDPDIYRTAFHSKEFPPGRNRGYYSNPQVDRWVTEGISLMDPQERKQVYLKVQEQIQKDLPILPLWYNQQMAIVHKRVQNYQLPENGDYSFLFKIHTKGSQ